jgi:hypothetical protein
MTPKKEKYPTCSPGTPKVSLSDDKANAGIAAAQPRKLPPGKYPGFSNLPAKPGVYRCKLWPELEKRDPNHADYKGVLQLTGSKASVLIWVHTDGTLGLRLEKIENSRKGARP